MRILLVIAICAFLAAPAQAAFEGPGAPAQPGGSFQGPIAGAQAATVAEALTLGDDAPVTLTGNIISQVAGSNDKFNFRDATGEMKVEIGRKVFQGRTVTPRDTVRISGKVDKDLGKPAEIDVKMLEIIKN